ncbi:MAG: SHOCT domain-containing protein [Sphaerochaetaceae bacterium]|nr:SHOCT domain-containing protein [Sphaerochaetaceae bacterium]MDD4219948.1 SHOCT domain-containing protein [Sphaerochaetaceae bacterium]MDY0371546.1 SHOCT domain-containing protein [Sphaerochaetaceae bacterium]
MMFLVLLLFILILYLIFRNTDFTRNRMPESNERSPLDILKQRYAEGALSQEEFLRMKEELSKKN